MKPRRSVSVPSWRSANSARTSSARATSWPMTMPPSAGDRTAVAPSARTRRPGRRRSPRHRADAAGPARTAGSRGCAARTTGGNGPRASAPERRNRARRSDSRIRAVVYRWGSAANPGAARRTSTDRRYRSGAGTLFADLPSLNPVSARLAVQTCLMESRQCVTRCVFARASC